MLLLLAYGLWKGVRLEDVITMLEVRRRLELASSICPLARMRLPLRLNA
jgi:hypothetical protein